MQPENQADLVCGPRLLRDAIYAERWWADVQMNQIRDAFDDSGALSSGSRREGLASFSQRHLNGQALLFDTLSSTVP